AAVRQFHMVLIKSMNYSGVEVVILEGFIATKILDYEKEHAVDLIVIGHHNRIGFDRLVVGSVSKKVIHDAICPVVVVK
ncbi:universal stress protein, partial [Carnobacterium maltaromaticum]|uniref:universal stress protein n=2 Tax=Carnobacterium maltaromaticum TaxID=2751 RepID=UPI00138F20E2